MSSRFSFSDRQRTRLNLPSRIEKRSPVSRRTVGTYPKISTSFGASSQPTTIPGTLPNFARNLDSEREDLRKRLLQRPERTRTTISDRIFQSRNVPQRLSSARSSDSGILDRIRSKDNGLDSQSRDIPNSYSDRIRASSSISSSINGAGNYGSSPSFLPSRSATPAFMPVTQDVPRKEYYPVDYDDNVTAGEEFAPERKGPGLLSSIYTRLTRFFADDRVVKKKRDKKRKKKSAKKTKEAEIEKEQVEKKTAEKEDKDDITDKSKEQETQKTKETDFQEKKQNVPASESKTSSKVSELEEVLSSQELDNLIQLVKKKKKDKSKRVSSKLAKSTHRSQFLQPKTSTNQTSDSEVEHQQKKKAIYDIFNPKEPNFRAEKLFAKTSSKTDSKLAQELETKAELLKKKDAEISMLHTKLSALESSLVDIKNNLEIMNQSRNSSQRSVSSRETFLMEPERFRNADIMVSSTPAVKETPKVNSMSLELSSEIDDTPSVKLSKELANKRTPKLNLSEFKLLSEFQKEGKSRQRNKAGTRTQDELENEEPQEPQETRDSQEKSKVQTGNSDGSRNAKRTERRTPKQNFDAEEEFDTTNFEESFMKIEKSLCELSPAKVSFIE